MSEPKWMAIARGELGVKEAPGAASNPRVEEYQRAVGMRQDDEVPWCAAFTGWCLEQAGIESTNSGAARSYARWGVELKEPRVGCVVVLWREMVKGPHGHVGFFEREDSKGIWMLSGNQGNAVTVKPFPRRRLLCFRWPSETMLADLRAATH
jgi:uncharacterized protein (TIGR02594 family)